MERKFAYSVICVCVCVGTIDTRRNKLVLKLEHKILNMKGKACIANQGDNFMYNLSLFKI